MSYRLPPISIIVTSGAGSAVLNSAGAGFLGSCITRGISPPTASPNATYSYYVQDQYGAIVDSNNGTGLQNWDGEKPYVGQLTFFITGASNDGTYTVHLWFSTNKQYI